MYKRQAQLIDPKHPRPLTVENLNVRSVKMTIDYNPQTNEYLLEKQRELKAELEMLDPASDRAHRITAVSYTHLNMQIVYGKWLGLDKGCADWEKRCV